MDFDPEVLVDLVPEVLVDLLPEVLVDFAVEVLVDFPVVLVDLPVDLVDLPPEDLVDFPPEDLVGLVVVFLPPEDFVGRPLVLVVFGLLPALPGLKTTAVKVLGDRGEAGAAEVAVARTAMLRKEVTPSLTIVQDRFG